MDEVIDEEELETIISRQRDFAENINRKFSISLSDIFDDEEIIDTEEIISTNRANHFQREDVIKQKEQSIYGNDLDEDKLINNLFQKPS